MYPALVSKVTFPTSGAKSLVGPRFIVMPLSPLASSPSILDIPNAHLSYIRLEPNNGEGEGRGGWEPAINTNSERGVWFPPRPFEGGASMGGVLAVAVEAASSAEIMDSTSSVQMSTFSRFRSTHCDFH